jgi:hypothetical protein
MKNKKFLILIAVIAVLAVGVAVFAILNAGDTAEKQAAQENATVTVKQGDVTKTFDLIYLKTFDKTEFSATMDTSKTGPEQKTFGGVPLVTVLKDLGFDLDKAETITLTAADGYASAITAGEVKDSENVYLVYERDGKQTLSKQQGGSGPIETVVRKDQFSQRWCKFLMEIDIK